MSWDKAIPERYHGNAQCMMLMQRILHTISPTHLRILYLTWPSSEHPIPLLPVSLPSLSELYAEGVDLTPSVQSGMAPQLKILHITSLGVGSRDIGSVLAHICPEVTHVYIRGSARCGPEGDPFLLFMHAFTNPHKPMRELFPTFPRWLSDQDLQAMAGTAYTSPIDPLRLSSLRKLVIGFTPIYVDPLEDGNRVVHKACMESLYLHVAMGGVQHAWRNARLGIPLNVYFGGRELLIFSPEPGRHEDLAARDRVEKLEVLKAQRFARSTGEHGRHDWLDM
ncbi:hypothetical protein EIP91_001834 [Steccherinum ochraceum]|uniref:Uncharacterized protein n=1 Tax=Steccherinum ochraceum TaxID=92696 RepID=A0A4R0RFQ0_9APHY|nr:hypothetical protein EIP91_001834 [Steccherinum ochraceum]